MSTPKFTTLGEVLLNARAYEWSDALHLPAGSWTAETRALVMYPEDDEDEEPQLARDNRMRYALGIDAVQDIVDNVRDQKPDATLADLVRAFQHYYERDAFIVLA